MLVRRHDGGAIAVALAGERGGTPLLLCHGLADSRLFADFLAPVGQASGLLLVAPDRPGTGRSDFRPLSCVVDWAAEAESVLDALGLDHAAVLGISAGGPFAAACAAALPARIRALVLVSSLGQLGWGTRGMAAGERMSLLVASRAPTFGGWFLGRLAALARRSPELFLRIATSELPKADRAALKQPEERTAFVAGYLEAFRHGSAGVAQDLRVLTRPWGFELSAIRVPTWIHHGDADTTVPLRHAHRFAAAISDAELVVHPGQGHFSLDVTTAEVLSSTARAAVLGRRD